MSARKRNVGRKRRLAKRRRLRFGTRARRKAWKAWKSSYYAMVRETPHIRDVVRATAAVYREWASGSGSV